MHKNMLYKVKNQQYIIFLGQVTGWLHYVRFNFPVFELSAPATEFDTSSDGEGKAAKLHLGLPFTALPLLVYDNHKKEKILEIWNYSDKYNTMGGRPW